MKADPEQTPDSYKSIEVVQTFDFDNNEDRSIDINKTADEEGKVYFHVVHQPPMSEISSHDDIVTLTSFKVGEDESVNEVYKQALYSAKEYYGDMQ